MDNHTVYAVALKKGEEICASQCGISYTVLDLASGLQETNVTQRSTCLPTAELFFPLTSVFFSGRRLGLGGVYPVLPAENKR